jgi:radical SAM superfamily enzyme YgiQ (UPF0313 family)
MKNLAYFAEIAHTGVGINPRAVPLGTGYVAANAVRELQGEIECKIFKFPTDLNDAIKRRPPKLLCLSFYVWNARLTHIYARYIKQHYPDVVIILGGPNFPIGTEDRKNFFEQNPHVDFYIKWEGEYAFVNLAKRLIEKDFDAYELKQTKFISDNCCYLVDGSYIEGPDQRISDLNSLPSPYLSGVMDEFFNYSLNILFETTRGCPYSCTFCNDGHIFRSKVYRKNHEFMQEELEYIATRLKHPAELHLADLNFGMFEDDLETSRVFRSLIDKHGWPNRIITSVGKSHPSRVLEAAEIINGDEGGIFKFGASLQSTDEGVLKKIKRKNIPKEELNELREQNLQSFERMEYFTELIVPLPGDTKEIHYNSLRECIDTMKMNNIDVHQLTLLPGTEMASNEEREEFGLDVRYRVFVNCLGLYEVGENEVPCAEIEEVVVATKDMTFNEYLECRVTDILVKIFIDHGMFVEVFGFIRKLGLSEFDLLLHLQQNSSLINESFSTFLDEFVEDTKRPLFKNLSDIEAHISNKEAIKKYISGEYGRNEVLTSRAKAFLDYSDATHDALRDGTLSYLQEHGVLTEEIGAYISQAVDFSKLRKFDIHDLKSIKKGEFDYDFIAASTRGYEVSPQEIKIKKSKIKFFYDKKSLELIEDKIRLWTSELEIDYGKFYQKSSLHLMQRCAEFN